eukprot:963677-Pleurochrysis_carterae.AAC.1
MNGVEQVATKEEPEGMKNGRAGRQGMKGEREGMRFHRTGTHQSGPAARAEVVRKEVLCGSKNQNQESAQIARVRMSAELQPLRSGECERLKDVGEGGTWDKGARWFIWCVLTQGAREDEVMCTATVVDRWR